MRKYQFVFDANVLIDVALQSGDDCLPTADLLNRVRSGDVEGWTTVPTVANVVCVVESVLRGDGVPDAGQMARKLVKKVLEGVHMLPVPGLMGIELLDRNPTDYGGALLLQAAMDHLPEPIVITRDRSFPSERCRVLHPAEVRAWAAADAQSSNETISFIDLAQQQRHIFPALERAIHTVLSHGKYIMGPEVRELEQGLVDFAGCKHVVSCSSGTDALFMALMGYGIGPGDAVFTTAFTFIATAEVVSVLGATPVFVDIDPKTFNIDPDKLEEAILETKREGKLVPKGIIPVDLFGLPADYDSIAIIADKHSLFVLEDAAQSLGGVYKGKQAGTFGNAAAISFFPAKPLGCYGDGGAVFTDDEELAVKCNSIRFHGKGSEKYDNVRIGVNSRLDTLQAAILLPKLAVFPEELRARQRVAAWYEEGLKDIVETPWVPPSSTSAWAQYSILSDHRDAIQSALKAQGVPSGIYYPRPLHLQTAFNDLGYGEGAFPVAELAAKRVLGLPMHPYMKRSEVERIVRIIQDCLGG